ncbi:hypothetical protein ACRS8P_02530 [Burkholderia cenocepacia]|nr:hypothetical protein [Burkholderia pseudomultivorans]
MHHTRDDFPRRSIVLFANVDVGEIGISGLQKPASGCVLEALDGQFAVNVSDDAAVVSDSTSAAHQLLAISNACAPH